VRGRRRIASHVHIDYRNVDNTRPPPRNGSCPS
jgi:hypothetical protein